MKQCSICKIEKSEEAFDTRKRKTNTGYSYHLHSACKACRVEYFQKHRIGHYARHKTTIIATNTEKRKDNVKWLNNYKQNLSCLDCGLSFKDEPYLCDFHHVTGVKKAQVTRMTIWARKTMIAEIAKCVPLCALCHRRRHYKESENPNSDSN